MLVLLGGVCALEEIFFIDDKIQRELSPGISRTLLKNVSIFGRQYEKATWAICGLFTCHASLANCMYWPYFKQVLSILHLYDHVLSIDATKGQKRMERQAACVYLSIYLSIYLPMTSFELISSGTILLAFISSLLFAPGLGRKR